MSDKKQIMFVDDEPNILQGIRRMLRTKRNEWELHFAESAVDALQALETVKIDVIVSDMRMPGMDGAELLLEVKNRYPDITRIVLSGHSEQEMILRSVGPAHQYLSKPCDSEQLRNVIDRACVLRDLMANQALKTLVSSLNTIPSFSNLYFELVKELQVEDVSIEKVSHIISQDIGMTARILQLVNSAFFGHAQNISNPEEAVSLLGIDTIRSLVLSFDVFSEFSEDAIAGFSINSIWEHSIITAVLAQQISNAESIGKELADEAFSAGLLHDVGKIILAANQPEEYAAVVRLQEETGILSWEAEKKVFGADHAEVGAYLLGLWGLPDPLVEAVAFHHFPGQCVASGFQPLTAVHVANSLEFRLGPSENNVDDCQIIDLEYLSKIGEADKLSDWEMICEVTLEEGLSDEIPEHCYRQT